MAQPVYYNPYQPQTPAQIPTPYMYQDQLSQLRGIQYQAQTPQQPQPAVSQGLLWVQGEAGAKSYLVAPNTTVLLMDSENQRFYIKSTDAAGMPSMRTFEYAEVSTNAQPAYSIQENPDNKYVTRDEFQRQYKEVMDRLDMLTAPKASTKNPVQKKGGFLYFVRLVF